MNGKGLEGIGHVRRYYLGRLTETAKIEIKDMDSSRVIWQNRRIVLCIVEIRA